MIAKKDISGTNSKAAKALRGLRTKKGRRKSGLFAAEGVRFVNHIPQSVYIEFYAFSESFAKNNASFTPRPDVTYYIFTDSVFSEFADTENTQGVIAVCRQSTASAGDIMANVGEKATVFIIDGVKDPGNLGTIVRSADSAGICALFLSKDCACVYNDKALRATMGSVFNVPICDDVDLKELIPLLKKGGFKVFAAHLKAELSYFEADFSGKSAVIIGGEAYGISETARDLTDTFIKIPIKGGAESLNAAIAATLIMYEIVRRG